MVETGGVVGRWRLEGEGEGVVDRGWLEGEWVVLWDPSNSDVIRSCLFMSHVTQPEDAVTARGGNNTIQYLTSVSLTAACVALTAAVPVCAGVHRIN